MMKNYAQMIKEASYRDYDPKYEVDYQDDAYMINLDDAQRADKIHAMREAAKRFAMRWVTEQLRGMGYVRRSNQEDSRSDCCRMDHVDQKMRVDIDLRGGAYHGFSIDGEMKIYDRSQCPPQTRTVRLRIKISTKNSKAKYMFRDLRYVMSDAKDNGEYWMLLVCDPKWEKVVDMTVYTDPVHQLKAGALEGVWYDPVHEPEWETDRLPDLFYEIMEKKQLENALISNEVETVKGKVTSRNGYLYFTFSEPPQFWSDYWDDDWDDWDDDSYEIPKHVRIRCTEDVPSVQGKEVLIVAVTCFLENHGVGIWLQAPEIRTEKHGTALMPAGGFVYI